MRWSDYIFEGEFWAHGAYKRSKPIATSGALIRGRRGEVADAALDHRPTPGPKPLTSDVHQSGPSPTNPPAHRAVTVCALRPAQAVCVLALFADWEWLTVVPGVPAVGNRGGCFLEGEPELLF
jgi:hypothetical protein